MKIQLIKEKGELPRMSTILKALENALTSRGYIIKELNHEAGYLVVNPDRGPFPPKKED